MNEENSQEKILKHIAREMVTKYNGWDEFPTDEEVENELQIAFHENGIESDEQFLREFADYIFSNLQTPTRVGIQPSTSSVVEIESLLSNEQSREITRVIATAALRNSIQNGGYRRTSIALGPETAAFLSSLADDDDISPKKDRPDEKTVVGHRKGSRPVIPAPPAPKVGVTVEENDDENYKKWLESGVKESLFEKPEKKDNSSLPLIMLATGIVFILGLTLFALFQYWKMPPVQISNQNENSSSVDLGSVEKIEALPTVVPLPPPVIIPTSSTQIVRKKICKHPPSCSRKQPGGKHSKKEEHLEEHLSDEL